MTEHKEKLPILNIDYSILVYKDVSEIEEKFKDKEWSYHLSEYDAFVYEDKGKFYICFWSSVLISQGKIAHECKHFVNMAFNYVEYRMDSYNDEIECYFLQYMVDKVNEVLKKDENNDPKRT
jgi:hypothetical protein